MSRLCLRLAFAVLAIALPLGGAAATANAAPVTHDAATGTAAHTAALITPNVAAGSCGFGSNLEINYADGGRTVCYTGSGYTGVSLADVTSVEASNPSWIRIYLNGTGAGSFFNLAPYETYYFYGAYGVTQVCDACGYHS